MLSTAIAAWRNLVKRLTVDWLILTAGTVTILLAMVLLAAGPIYADAVTESSLRRTLSQAPVTKATAVVEVRTAPRGLPHRRPDRHRRNRRRLLRSRRHGHQARRRRDPRAPI